MDYIIKTDSVAYLDNYFFSKPQPIPKADPGTFEVLAKWFARDHRQIYFLYRAVTGADPESFVYLGGYDCQWAKDESFAYYFWPTKAARQWRALKSKSLGSFQVLPGCQFSEYARDDEAVFYKGKKIRGADPQSFQIMTARQIEDGSASPSHHFARDERRIYFDGKPVKGVDGESFQVIHTDQASHREYGSDGARAIFYDWARTKRVVVPCERLPTSLQEVFRGLPGLAVHQEQPSA
jgi:hypothetical protein